MTKKNEAVNISEWSCPIPVDQYPTVVMAHGGGGRLMNQLIDKMFAKVFSNPLLDRRHDGAMMNLPKNRIAFTTDSYVVQPLFFPGGNIGDLAVNGTVNDLAMCGARPLFLSAGFIIEEGLAMESLWKIVLSMKQCADAANVQIVTGDTKVVDHGKGDGIFINTSGIGIIEKDIFPEAIRPGDRIVVNSDIGRHGMAIMAVREGLSFESDIRSDTAPLSGLVMDLIDANIDVHCLRDATRGGLASVLVELSHSSGYSFAVNESDIPVRDDVLAACELLGLDPMYVANEGCMVAFIADKDTERALEIMRRNPSGKDAVMIGQVMESKPVRVTMKSRIGAQRIIDMISGEQLPRIC
jgi:hydrogenase expression/formation protein HypE